MRSFSISFATDSRYRKKIIVLLSAGKCKLAFSSSLMLGYFDDLDKPSVHCLLKTF